MRIFLFLALFFLCIFAFSQENIEFNFSCKYDYSANVNIKDFSSSTVSMVIGFTGVHYFTDVFGLFLNMNLNFPFINFVSYNNTSSITNWSDKIFWLGIEGFLGPAFNIVRNQKFSIPIVIGFHIMRMNTIYDCKGAITRNYGFGMNIGYERNMNKNFYVSLRVFTFFDLVSNTDQKNIYEFFSDERHFDNRNWGIAPTLGIGLRI